MADPVQFAAVVIGLFSRQTEKDPLIATYNVDQTGRVVTDLDRTSGRSGDRWERVFQHAFTTTVDPAFTNYIRAGTVPTGPHDLVTLFNSVRPQLDDARSTLFPPTAPDRPEAPEDFDPIIRPGPGAPGIPSFPSEPGVNWLPFAEGGAQLSPVGLEDFFVPRFVRSAHRSVPGGVFGFAQQTPAGQRQLVGGGLGGATRRRARSRPRPTPRAGPRRLTRAPSKRRPVKGKYNSAAWMAKIRKMRKK